MEITKLLPYKTALDLSSFKNTLKDIVTKKVFCVESFYAYIDRHKNQINKEEAIKVFQAYPKLLGLEFIREFLRNYFQINGTIKLDIYNVALLENKDIKSQIAKNLINNLYTPIYNNSITGRLYCDYQKWENIQGKHQLQYLTNEEVFSIDVNSCILTIYINFLKKMNFNINDTFNRFYKEDVDFYLFFILKTFLPNLIDKEGNYYLEEIKSHFKNKKNIVKEIVTFLGLSNKKSHDIIHLLRTTGKKITIPLLFQGKDIQLTKFSKIMEYNDKTVEYRVYGPNSVLQFGEWNKYIYNLLTKFDKSCMLNKFYSLYIPKCEYLNDDKKISSYILENIANYSIFNAMIKLILNGIEIKGYFFDELYIPIKYKDRLPEIKNIFLNNNLVPLKITEEF